MAVFKEHERKLVELRERVQNSLQIIEAKIGKVSGCLGILCLRIENSRSWLEYADFISKRRAECVSGSDINDFAINLHAYASSLRSAISFLVNHELVNVPTNRGNIFTTLGFCESPTAKRMRIERNLNSEIEFIRDNAKTLEELVVEFEARVTTDPLTNFAMWLADKIENLWHSGQDVVDKVFHHS